MKKYIKNLTIILVSFLLFSCSKEDEQKAEPLTYTYQTIKRQHPRCTDQAPDNGCVELTYTFPSFTGERDMPVNDTLRKAAGAFIFDSTGRNISEASFDWLAQDWFSLYDSTRAAMQNYSLPWKQNKQVRIIRQTPDYLSAEFSMREFSGGAHGIEIKQYQMYRIPGGERLSLSDLLVEDGVVQLASVAESAFGEQKKEPDAVEFDERNYWSKEGSLALNKNFALTEKGLLFYYNPYEIAPYSEGPTKLLLSYERIDTLLADPFRPSSSVNN